MASEDNGVGGMTIPLPGLKAMNAGGFRQRRFAIMPLAEHLRRDLCPPFRSDRGFVTQA